VTPRSDARRHMIGVRAGTLDDPEIGKPQMTIWTASAPSWAVFDPNAGTPATLAAILKALEEASVKFTNGKRPGGRLRD
jgi:hypothetical protein